MSELNVVNISGRGKAHVGTLYERISCVIDEFAMENDGVLTTAEVVGTLELIKHDIASSRET